MRKFSKILERKENILEVIDITENEIKEVIQPLLDEFDYAFDYSNQWITKSGNIYYKANQASETYPTLLISLKRSDGVKKDPRNWNGGIYYEDDSNVIKLLYETIKRLESLVATDEIKLYYAIRSVNDIQIRIATPIEVAKIPIDLENIENFISNISSLKGLPYEEYKVEDAWQSGDERVIEISPVSTQCHTDVSYFDASVPCDVILSRIIKNNSNNNIWDLMNTSNYIIRQLLTNCTKGNLGSSGLTAEYFTDSSDGSRYEFGYNDVTYIKHLDRKSIKITSNVNSIGKKKITVSKGIFKNDVREIELFSVELTIKILVS